MIFVYVMKTMEPVSALGNGDGVSCVNLSARNNELWWQDVRLVLFMINLPTQRHFCKADKRLEHWNLPGGLCACAGRLMFDVRHLSSSVEIIDIKSGINTTKCKMRPFTSHPFPCKSSHLHSHCIDQH